MSFLLDTDICSAHLRSIGGVPTRVQQYAGQLAISTITLGELFTWALRRRTSRRYLPGLLAFLSDVDVLDADFDVARQFGEIRAALLDAGRPVPIADLWIAATALVHGQTLVTHNTSDFAAVPGLSIVDWLAS